MSSKNSFLKNILVLLSPYKAKVLATCLFMLLGAIINVLMPLVNMKIVDQGILALNFRSLITLCALSLGLYLISQSLDFLEFKQLSNISKHLEIKLTLNAYSHLFNLPLQYFKDNNETQIMNNLRYDIGKILRISDRTMCLSIVQVFNVIGGIIGLCLIDIRLLLLVLLSAPVKLVAMHFFSKRRENLFSKIIPILNKVGLWVGDTIENIETVKLWTLYQKKLIELKKLEEESVDVSIKVQQNDKISEYVDYSISFFIDLLIYIIGFWEILSGRLSVGGLFAFTSYSAQVLSPISFIARIRFHLADIKPSMNRHIEFLELPEEASEAGLNSLDLVTIPNKISFHNISFCVQNAKILSHVSFDLYRGEKVAIVGENGSGKSSLLNLLLRFYEPTEGAITFDGIDIRSLSLRNYRNCFSVVRQDIRLFNSTIQENIDPFGLADENDIKQLCQMCGSEFLLDKFPHGLKTETGKGGSKLSGGERQKISALRALLKDAKILIIDEGTSSYDTASENEFNKFLEASNGYDYVIVVTHRNEILKGMDRVIRIENGVIIASDTKTRKKEDP